MTREGALQIIWNRCQHSKETEEALEVLKAERPHGEWLKKDTYFGKCWATCSVCKKISDGTGQDNGFGHDYSYPNFCPNCGADMREGEEGAKDLGNR